MGSTGTTGTTGTSTMHPFLNSPFDKLPFMDTSYEVRPHRLQQQQVEPPEQQFHHYQHAPSSTTTTTTTTTATEEAPRSVNRERERERERDRERGSSDESHMADPLGMLKLAGCNIYGRMYRVGRIIVELSSQCLECKCTEVGVKCGPLDC
ncbi:GL18614 [Drosophila persimilis]|uniref:GL18614 n=2 Tax=Drosophila persimilis TaxID=7234 RepID=B4G9N9_DROPE|nr:GL18614 [Drosophila persimilis]